MAEDPFQLFDEWFAKAKASEPHLPEAMALATADADGRPSVRMVLMKDHGPDGFVFYTNQHSRKGEDLAQRSRAALLFYWKSLQRQVRIEGPVGRVPGGEADAYFATRSRDSQLGAWASDQSSPLGSRAEFERRYEALREKFDGLDIPRPQYWGGYRVDPESIEFWTERPGRLHERRLFKREAGGWSEGLLYP